MVRPNFLLHHLGFRTPILPPDLGFSSTYSSLSLTSVTTSRCSPGWFMKSCSTVRPCPTCCRLSSAHPVALELMVLFNQQLLQPHFGGYIPVQP